MKFILAALLLWMPSAFARLQVMPSSVSFYGVEVGSFGTQRTVYIYNWGDQAVHLRVNDYCYGDFRITNWCFQDLRPNGSCSIDVHFDPRTVGFQSCTIWIQDDTGQSENVSVSGQGVDNY